MSDFHVSGPFDVPTYKGKKGRIVRSEEGDAFFTSHPTLAHQRGCFVFGMRAGGGITPTYVGKATKGFGQECFTAHKLGKCNETLVDYLRGTLIVIFVSAPAGRCRPATKQIKLVEDFLIQTGIGVNPDLLNVKGTKQADWSIRGVLRAARGRPSKSAAAFERRCGCSGNEGA
jgi:hypothetical protein